MSSFGALRSSREILLSGQRGLPNAVLSGWIAGPINAARGAMTGAAA